MIKKALVILADGFEEIEAITAIDILRRAGIEVAVAGLQELKVTGAHGLAVMADKKLVEVTGNFEACVLPGGLPGAANLAASKLVTDILKKMQGQGKIIAAICAAPALVLSPLGILDGKNATCYSGMEKEFKNNTRFKPDPVVVDGNVITSRGPSTALLFALAIVEKLLGREASEELRKATLLDETAVHRTSIPE